MMAVWPSSLASDRMNQLSILQVFQMTLLIAAVFRGLQILRIRKKNWVPILIIVLLCTMLYYWSSMAKTDTAAILFSTLALAMAVRESRDKSHGQYNSWLFMGLALATKQTAFLILIPFILYKGYSFYTSSIKSKLISLFCIAFIPSLFAVRTMIHTGSPTYPVHQITSMVKDDWQLLPEPDEISTLNNRSSAQYSDDSNYSVFKHIGIFVLNMEGISLLLLSGLVIAFIKNDRSWILFLPLIVYFAVSIFCFCSQLM